MKISLEWLSEYLPGPGDAEAFGDALTHGGLPVENFEKHGNDTVMDVEVTSNRGDCLSHVGVARELAALLSREFKDVEPKARETNVLATSAASVDIAATQLCPHYIARILRGVKIGPSPAWLTRRLEAVGLRPINNVVDVTNYVMFEMGQPLHAFDFDKIDGRRIIVRNAEAGEKITSIDGHERSLTPGMLVIADASRPVALAGVMGGRDSEVSFGTVNVLLESARFDPLSVRKTARSLAMKSDSSYRFERGIDPTLPERASIRAAQLIQQLAGGELLAGSVVAGSSGYEPKKLSLRLQKLKSVLGVEFPTSDVVDALRRLKLSPVLNGDRVDVTVPSHRLDINIEVDLVEEVARVVGYDKIPMRDEIAIRVTPPEAEARTLNVIRDTLVAGGYFEAVTFSFVSDALSASFVPAEAKALPRADASVRKADANLRPSLLPGLLEAVRHNETVGNAGAKLYEVGSTFWIDVSGKIDERRQLGLVAAGEVREVRGVVETLLTKLDKNRSIQVIPDSRVGFATGACGRIEWGGEIVGYLGRIDRAISQKIGLRDLPAAAELLMAPLLSGAQSVPQLKPLPRFPAVRRDLSLVVSEGTRYEQLSSLIRELKPQWLEDVEYVTTYRGKPLDRGVKSITVTLIFRSPESTLTSDNADAAIQQVVGAARDRLGATVRS